MYFEYGTNIFYFEVYLPTKIWINGVKTRNPAFNKNTGGRILDLKRGDKEAIQYYYKNLIDTFGTSLKNKKNTSIALVPSSKPDNFTSGLITVAQVFAKKLGLIDATKCLIRHKEIKKLAYGGNRSKETHFESIRIENTGLIKDKYVILLDDVTTSGNSLLACKEILENAGSKNVLCVALAKNKTQ